MRLTRYKNAFATTYVSLLFGLGCGGARPHYDSAEGGSTSSGGTTSQSVSGTATGGTQTGTSTAPQQGGTTTNTTVPYAGSAGTLVEIKPAWDYNGIIGTGQNLSVGNTPVISKTQPYNNLMLSLGAATVPPWDPNVSGLSLVPLVELKNQVNYPAPYPLNRFGETPHSAMANQLSAVVKWSSNTDFVSVHTVVGESGQGMVALSKRIGDDIGESGRAYSATLFEVGAIAKLAQAAGKTYGVGAILMTHGETDSGSSSYETELIQLLSDYNTDIPAITGQSSKIPMFISQQFAFPSDSGKRPISTLVQWQLGVTHPGDFVCTGPKYQYPGHGDGTHLSTEGYQMLGEKYAQVYYERVLIGNDWQPLQPISASRDGRIVTVKFHVPVPPLIWDETFPEPVTSSWPKGKGFELRRANSVYSIESVEIVEDSVKITAGVDLPETGLIVGYAMSSTGTQMTNASKAYRWGLLRDSDPYVGTTTVKPNPNYCVAFDLTVP
jgi:hypothetical protein